MKWFPVVLGLLVLETGCSLIARPEIRDVRARIDGINLRGVNLVFDVDVYNPYPAAVRSPEFGYGLDIAEKEFIRSNRTTQVDLPARNVGTLVLPVQIEYLALWRAYQDLSGADEVDYRLYGNLVLKAMEQSFEIPISYRGKFPIFRLPSLSMPQVSVSDVSLAGAKVVIQTDISNPNVFRLGLGRMGFDVKLGDVQVASVRPSLPDGLDPKASGKLSLVGQITASKALAQLLSGSNLGKPTIQYTGHLETPYGQTPIDR